MVSKDGRRAPKLCAIFLTNHRVFASTSRGIIHEKKKFSVLVEKDEDGYLVATVPTLPGCHTQARSMDDLLERVKEAIEAYLEAEKDVDISEFVGVQVVEAEAG